MAKSEKMFWLMLVRKKATYQKVSAFMNKLNVQGVEVRYSKRKNFNHE